MPKPHNLLTLFIVEELTHKRDVSNDEINGDDVYPETMAYHRPIKEAIERALYTPTYGNLATEPLALASLRNTREIWADNLTSGDVAETKSLRADIRKLDRCLNACSGM